MLVCCEKNTASDLFFSEATATELLLFTFKRRNLFTNIVLSDDEQSFLSGKIGQKIVVTVQKEEMFYSREPGAAGSKREAVMQTDSRRPDVG